MGSDRDSFSLAEGGRPVGVYVSASDHPCAIRAARLFAGDLEALCGAAPALAVGGAPASARGAPAVLLGTLGRGGPVDALADSGRIGAGEIAGGRERYLRAVVEGGLPPPLDGVGRALVIAGSDRRGTIYGALDLSASLGVSPWRWWADVPVVRRPDVVLEEPGFVSRSPAVRYRGIFLNDEEPCLGRWAREKFGGLNAAFYEKVLELVLRLGGNFLWPAMWGKSFFEDDPASPVLAEEMGVVIGTSHHEPMCRAHDEWRRHGKGPWNFEANAPVLRDFWREGYARSRGREVVATIGMRGDGDEPMSEAQNIALLERIVREQREIIAEVSGAAPEEQPQAWAVYKEVQKYYDMGMRVPEDATIVLSDDNWGNVRTLPPRDGAGRSGGYGMYYHLDYVGGPRCYKWIGTTQNARVWEQMRLCYEGGVDRLWVLNVGDLKPYEYSIDFFLSLARDADRMDGSALELFARSWAERQFGPAEAEAIGGVLADYERLSSRRKPELLSAHTYSLVDFREAERVSSELASLVERARRAGAALATESSAAYRQLVLHPVLALANLHELYFALSRNALYAAQGRASANVQADLAEELFRADADLSRAYNEDIGGGAWRHMMDQPHIGYTYWRDPEYDVLPALSRIEASDGARMGVAVEGSEAAWPGAAGSPSLPALDPYAARERRIEVFNRGLEAFSFRAEPSESWLRVEPAEGIVGGDAGISVSVDWDKAPSGESRARVALTGSEGTVVEVEVRADRPAEPDAVEGGGFVEGDGCVAIEAEHFARAAGAGGLSWSVVPRLGKTLSAMTVFPAPARSGSSAPLASDGATRTPEGASFLEYRLWLHREAEVEVEAFLSPPQDLFKTGGPRYALAFDGGRAVEVRLPGLSEGEDWERFVSDNAARSVTAHGRIAPGWHTLRYIAVDPGLPLQRLVVWTRPRRNSYLGPPESARSGR